MVNTEIQPALTAKEWEERATEYQMLSFAPGSLSISADCGGYNTTAYTFAHDLAKVIAMANAALADNDPRKITREWVGALRRLRHRVGTVTIERGGAEYDVLERVAEALASYLPPV